ncbi:MAG: ABC transporter ATP-binding protein, partial [Deltaproteobacteria bacterium]|nr:ABC transporter ATP-binding protein [Deltaproteobacteria bacterium]
MRPRAAEPRPVRPGDWRLLARLWPVTRPYRSALLAGVGFMGLGAAGRMAGPYLIKVAIDGPVVRGDARGLALLAALYL